MRKWETRAIITFYIMLILLVACLPLAMWLAKVVANDTMPIIMIPLFSLAYGALFATVYEILAAWRDKGE